MRAMNKLVLATLPIFLAVLPAMATGQEDQGADAVAAFVQASHE